MDPVVLNNLAIAVDRKGNYFGAEVLYKQCLDKMNAVLGGSHPDTLGAMSNLACVFITKTSIENLRSCTSSS